MSDKQDKRYIEVTSCRGCKKKMSVVGCPWDGRGIPDAFEMAGDFEQLIHPDCPLLRPEEALSFDVDAAVEAMRKLWCDCCTDGEWNNEVAPELRAILTKYRGGDVAKVLGEVEREIRTIPLDIVRELAPDEKPVDKPTPLGKFREATFVILDTAIKKHSGKPVTHSDQYDCPECGGAIVAGQKHVHHYE